MEPWQPNIMINVTSLTFLSSTISFSTVTSRHLLHMVFTCRYSRTCNSSQDFLHQSVLLTRKLLSQSFIETRLRSTLKKFFVRYYHLTLPYSVSVTTMTNVICKAIICLSWVRVIPLYDIGDIMMDAACGAENVYHSGTPDFTPGFHVLSFVSPYCMW